MMEYTGNDMQNDTHLTSSLLKMFSMFEIRLSIEDVDLDEVSLKCIYCKRETGLKTKSGFEEFYDKIITPFVMNSNTGLSQLNQLCNGFLFLKLWDVLEMTCKMILI